jgi:trigger factor
VAGIAVEGIRLECVPEMLKGAKAGETRTAKITIGQDAEKEDLRGKEVEVRIKVNEVRRVALPDDLAVLKETDYEDMDSLKGALRRQLEGQSDQAFREAQERAVQDWLLEKIPLDLPTELAQRHANRILQRNVMNLQYRGVPVEEIEKQAMEIRSASTEAASRDLKLFFILDAIAKKETVEATDAEVDARIRLMAMQSNRKPDRIREEMEEAGTLDNLYSQIVEDKVLRLLLEKAKIGGAAEAKAAPEVPAAEAPAAEPPPAPPAEEKPKAGDVEST